MRELALHGIFSSGGKTSIYKGGRTDLVAWGCIKIEAKLAIWDGCCWRWSFTKDQRKNSNFDFCIVILPRKDQWAYHIFPIGCEIFPLKKEVMFYYPNGYRNIQKTKEETQIVSTQLMTLYKDRWDLIEERRQNIIRDMINGDQIDYKILHQEIRAEKTHLIQQTMF